MPKIMAKGDGSGKGAVGNDDDAVKNGTGSDDDAVKNGIGSSEVVQHMKEAGVTLRYPMLAKNNYGAWAVKMKIFMRAQGVWTGVEGKGAVDDRLDQMALAAIVQAVSESVIMATSENETAKKVWDALREMHVGEERVTKARVQTLRRKLDGMYMAESEKFNEFALKVTSVVNEIRTLGMIVEESTVVQKLLRSVPDKFQPIVSTIEQWANLEVMKVPELIGRLRAFEESLKPRRREREEEKLLMARDEPRLTRAEWEAIVAKEKRSDNGFDSGTNNNGDKKKYRGRFDKSKIDCRNCGEYGHFANECPEPRKVTKAMAQLTVADADNESPLM